MSWERRWRVCSRVLMSVGVRVVMIVVVVLYVGCG